MSKIINLVTKSDCANVFIALSSIVFIKCSDYSEDTLFIEIEVDSGHCFDAEIDMDDLQLFHSWLNSEDNRVFCFG